MFVTYCISTGRYIIFAVIELILTWNWSFLLYFKTLTKCRLLHFDHVVQLGKVSFALAAFTRGIKCIMLQCGISNGIYYIKQFPNVYVYIYMWPLYQLHIMHIYILFFIYCVESGRLLSKVSEKENRGQKFDIINLNHRRTTYNQAPLIFAKQRPVLHVETLLMTAVTTVVFG